MNPNVHPCSYIHVLRSLNIFVYLQIDGKCVTLMRDEQLKSFGLSAAGDIILLKEFCTERSEKIPTMELEPRKKRATLLKRMMEEMGSSGTTRLRSASQCNTTGRPRAVSKSVTLGLRIPKGIASEAYKLLDRSTFASISKIKELEVWCASTCFVKISLKSVISQI